MELKNVSERIEWEARRVAAAFGFEHPIGLDPKHLFYQVHAVTMDLVWLYQDADCQLHKLWLYQIAFSPDGTLQYEQHRMVRSYNGRTWYLDGTEEDTRDTDRHLARGLYCLGIEDGHVLAQLDSPLSAHEQIELRLSMPREFWPKTWLEE